MLNVKKFEVGGYGKEKKFTDDYLYMGLYTVSGATLTLNYWFQEERPVFKMEKRKFKNADWNLKKRAY